MKMKPVYWLAVIAAIIVIVLIVQYFRKEWPFKDDDEDNGKKGKDQVQSKSGDVRNVSKLISMANQSAGNIAKTKQAAGKSDIYEQCKKFVAEHTFLKSLACTLMKAATVKSKINKYLNPGFSKDIDDIISQVAIVSASFVIMIADGVEAQLYSMKPIAGIIGKMIKLVQSVKNWSIFAVEDVNWVVRLFIAVEYVIRYKARDYSVKTYIQMVSAFFVRFLRVLAVYVIDNWPSQFDRPIGQLFPSALISNKFLMMVCKTNDGDVIQSLLKKVVDC